jgi:hypothetical protein
MFGLLFYFIFFFNGFLIIFFLIFFTFTTHNGFFFQLFHLLYLCLSPQLFSSLVILFGMGTNLRFFYKSKAPSTRENWHFNLSLFAPASDSTPFHALGKAKNALLLATTL